MISPVSQPASSEARNTARRAMSSGWPTRPSDVLAIICFLDSVPMTPSEKVIAVNPTAALYTPKSAKRSESQAMSADQVELALGAVEYREQVILRLAIFAGMRPGELLAIQRGFIAKFWEEATQASTSGLKVNRG